MYQAEKTIRDLGDKGEPALKAKVEESTAALKAAIESNDKDTIRQSMDKLTAALSEFTSAIYAKMGGSQPGQEGAPGQEGPGGNFGQQQGDQSSKGDDDVIDAEYKVKE